MPEAKPVLSQHSYVAGLRHYGYAEIASKITPNETLRLAAEPENKFDAKAVAIYWQGNKIGYLPQTENAAVSAALLSCDYNWRCVVQKHEPFKLKVAIEAWREDEGQLAETLHAK